MNNNRFIKQYQQGGAMYRTATVNTPSFNFQPLDFSPVERFVQNEQYKQELQYKREQDAIALERQRKNDRIKELQLMSEMSTTVGGMQFLPGKDTEAAKSILNDSGYNEAMKNNNIEEMYSAYAQAAPQLQQLYQKKFYYDKAQEKYSEMQADILKMYTDPDMVMLLGDVDTKLDQWGENLKAYANGDIQDIAAIDPSNFGLAGMIDPVKREEFYNMKKEEALIINANKKAQAEYDMARTQVALTQLPYEIEQLKLKAESLGLINEQTKLEIDAVKSKLEGVTDPTERLNIIRDFSNKVNKNNVPGSMDAVFADLMVRTAAGEDVSDLLQMAREIMAIKNTTEINYNTTGTGRSSSGSSSTTTGTGAVRIIRNKTTGLATDMITPNGTPVDLNKLGDAYKHFEYKEGNLGSVGHLIVKGDGQIGKQTLKDLKKLGIIDKNFTGNVDEIPGVVYNYEDDTAIIPLDGSTNPSSKSQSTLIDPDLSIGTSVDNDIPDFSTMIK